MARGAYIQFDETTSDLSDNAFRVLCYLRNHLGKSNCAYPSIESMSEDLKRSTRTCKRAIAELKTAGFVSVSQARNGAWEYTVKRADSEPKPVTKLSPRGDTHGDTHGDTDSDTDSDKFVIPPKNPLIGEQTEHTEQTEGSSGGSTLKSKPDAKATTTTTTENIEPFESANSGTLPNVRNAVEPFRPRLVELKPTQFKTETRDRMMVVLGIDADQFARKVTQQQADAGFVDWVLSECKRNKTPGRLAFHLLKTAWRDGWIDPKAEEEAKRAARRKRLEALK